MHHGVVIANVWLLITKNSPPSMSTKRLLPSLISIVTNTKLPALRIYFSRIFFLPSCANPFFSTSHGVSGYPTIKYFARGSKSAPEDYEGSRSLDSFVEFINERAGTQRKSDGTLGEKAGLVAEFDEIVAKFKSASDKKSVVQEASELSAKLGTK